MTELSNNYVAWWGAGLATLLGLIKVWETWRDRFRINVSHVFTSSISEGNTILVRNLSLKPFILAHWELFYGQRYFHFVAVECIEEKDFFVHDQKIDSMNTLTLNFNNQSYFRSDPQAMKGRSIYIRLHIAGRGSKVYRVATK